MVSMLGTILERYCLWETSRNTIFCSISILVELDISQFLQWAVLIGHSCGIRNPGIIGPLRMSFKVLCFLMWRSKLVDHRAAIWELYFWTTVTINHRSTNRSQLIFFVHICTKCCGYSFEDLVPITQMMGDWCSMSLRDWPK